MIDSLDVMIIMGLDAQYEKCKQWIAEHLEFGSAALLTLCLMF